MKLTTIKARAAAVICAAGSGAAVMGAAYAVANTRGVPTGEDAWYGMGLEENDYWGVPVIHHGGSMGGYKTDIMLIPDAQIGAGARLRDAVVLDGVTVAAGAQEARVVLGKDAARLEIEGTA